MPFFLCYYLVQPDQRSKPLPQDDFPSTMSEKQQLWQQLAAHQQALKSLHMRDLFNHDDQRGRKFTRTVNHVHFDFSKNILTEETLGLLTEFARACHIEDQIKAMFRGDRINHTENRAVLHTALRAGIDEKVEVDGRNVIPEVYAQLDKIRDFVTAVHSGQHRGYTGKQIDTFVNIGIGGSDLGPKMVVDALAPFRHGKTRSFFISNIDYQQVAKLQHQVDPETTMFIVSSKSFSTLETFSNAASLQDWMKQAGCTEINKHFVAISSNIDAAVEFGIDPDNIFSIWDWVGGRFSLWSATGLPIALALGYDNFRQLLDGAAAMDQHFRHTELTDNIPVILGLLDFWYNNFFGADTHAFVPYDEALALLPEFLSQLFMESNGKSADNDGQLVNYETMPVTWGSTGTNAQHAFFQLLHQGTKLVPVDFLAPLSKQGDPEHHAWLLANCIAQSQALMQGEQSASAHNHFPGNKPSNSIFYSRMTPATLGTLLAMFEHRTFVQGILWNINSFDQWGVELGKKLAKKVYSEMSSTTEDKELDSSTRALIELYKKTNR